MSAEMLNVREELKRLQRPSERDLEVFEAVVGRKCSQEQTARAFGVTQGRVSQIVAEVRAWLIAATDDEAGDLPPELALRYAGRVVRMRLEALLGMCMEAFNESKQDKSRPGSGGDPRWLGHYRQVALAVARLDGVQTAPKVERSSERDAETEARILARILQQASEPIEQPAPVAAPQPTQVRPPKPTPEEFALYNAYLDKLEHMSEEDALLAVSQEFPVGCAEDIERRAAPASSPKIANNPRPVQVNPSASAADRRRAFLRGSAA